MAVADAEFRISMAGVNPAFESVWSIADQALPESMAGDLVAGNVAWQSGFTRW